MPPKGELETIYGGPWGGLDYSRPYNVLDPQFLAPGSINTSQMNGWLTSSPWLTSSFYATAFAAGEYIIGNYPVSAVPLYYGTAPQLNFIVTNIAVYISQLNTSSSTTFSPWKLTVVHTWTTDVSTIFFQMSETISFVQIASVVYFSGIMLNGIFSYDLSAGVFATATTYVSTSHLIELAGYLVAAECRFPTGGGTGVFILPTVAWSGPGEYAGSGASDPWNPVNQLGGGFNELSDVPDSITGLAAIGRSALIFRNFGVSQMDPNPGTSNSGLQPFTFYHLWASSTGVGALLGSVAQYGQQVQFLSADNVYSISISAGLQPVGQRIIPKINSDYFSLTLQAGVVGNGTSPLFNTANLWFYASIIIIDGQQHYLLILNAYKAPTAGATATPVATCEVFDYNITEQSWHIWNFAQYIGITGTAQPFQFISCPITAVLEGPTPNSPHTQVSTYHLMVAGITGYAPETPTAQSGSVFSLVPWNYDVSNSFPTAFQTPVFTPVAMPQTTIVLRAEIVSLGHKVSVRRLRVQADNAPLPSFANNSQQQAVMTLTGMTQGSVKTAPLAWTDSQGKIHPYMQGNYPAQGMSIQTYYGNETLSDEMVQPSIAALVADPANPWNSLPAFRISTMSLIMDDTTGTTQ